MTCFWFKGCPREYFWRWCIHYFHVLSGFLRWLCNQNTWRARQHEAMHMYANEGSFYSRFCFRKLELQSSFSLYMGMATNDFTNNKPILWLNLIIRTWPQILFEQLIIYSSYLSKFNCIHFARGMMQQAAAPTDVKFQVSTGRLPHGSKFLRILIFRGFEVFSTTLIQKTKILSAKIFFMIESGTENDSITAVNQSTTN